MVYGLPVPAMHFEASWSKNHARTKLKNRRTCRLNHRSGYSISSAVELPFANREAAGRLLAEELKLLRLPGDTLVLALVRGGVVIGREIAKDLRLPLYPYMVRKLGHPAHREYGLGAIAEGGATYLDEAAMHGNGLTWEDLEPVIEEETKELARRKQTYAVQPRPPLKGKTVILTDDGAATGSTLFAAIDDLKNARVRHILIALPVAPHDTLQELRKRADTAVVLATPPLFMPSDSGTGNSRRSRMIR